MPTPWDDFLIHTVNLWHQGVGQDSNAGLTNPYPAPYATNVPCYVETEGSTREYNAQDRITLMQNLTVFFGANTGFALNDRMDWVDALSVTHKLFLTGIVDMTPQGGMCEVAAEERPTATA